MISPETLLGQSISDDEFKVFWRPSSILGKSIEVEGEYTISNPELGVSVVLDEDLKVTSINMLKSGATDVHRNYSTYRGLMPCKLSFEMTKNQVLLSLGEPIEENREYSTFLGVEILPWTKFEIENYLLNVTYDKNSHYIVGVSVAMAS